MAQEVGVVTEGKPKLNQMEEHGVTGSADGGGGGGSYGSHMWWAMAGAAQLGWGIASYKRGFAGSSDLMPLKAFAVASLFVGAGASSAIAFLKSSGIHTVEDLMKVGANIRTGLGIPPRARDE